MSSKSRLGGVPLVRRNAERRDRGFERSGVRAADVQGVSERHCLLHPGASGQLVCQVKQIGSFHRPGGEMAFLQ